MGGEFFLFRVKKIIDVIFIFTSANSMFIKHKICVYFHCVYMNTVFTPHFKIKNMFHNKRYEMMQLIQLHNFVFLETMMLLIQLHSFLFIMGGAGVPE